MSFGSKTDVEMTVAEVFEVFQANARTHRDALAPNGIRVVFHARSEWAPGEMNGYHAEALLGKIRKRAVVQTREQVGERAWSKAMGANGRGWRGAPTAAQRRAAVDFTS